MKKSRITVEVENNLYLFAFEMAAALGIPGSVLISRVLNYALRDERKNCSRISKESAKEFAEYFDL